MRARAAVSLCLVLASVSARAEVQQWTEIGVSRSLTKRWQLSFDQHLRLDQDISRVDSVMPEWGVTYRLAKWLRAEVGYRLQYTRDGDGEMVLRHRFHGGVRARHDLGDVRLQYRLQYQEQLRPGANDQLRHSIRNRAEVGYRRFKHWAPGASFELFHAIGDGDAVHLDKVRIKAGLEYGKKDWSVELYYCAEAPVADEMDPTLHVVGLGAHYEL